MFDVHEHKILNQNIWLFTIIECSIMLVLFLVFRVSPDVKSKCNFSFHLVASAALKMFLMKAGLEM